MGIVSIKRVTKTKTYRGRWNCAPKGTAIARDRIRMRGGNTHNIFKRTSSIATPVYEKGQKLKIMTGKNHLSMPSFRNVATKRDEFLIRRIYIF